MKEQKLAIVVHVREQKAKGIKIGQTLDNLKIKRSSYYRWAAELGQTSSDGPKVHSGHLTGDEKAAILAVKNDRPWLRHRQVQGLLQGQGNFVSASSVYRLFKQQDLVESYERRPAPLDEALYEIYRRNIMWGADWSKLKVAGIRYYLLTLIDFFSRFVVAHMVVPGVTAREVKQLYQMGLDEFNIPKNCPSMPALRVDRGSPNTALITKEFFKTIGADLSFSRVRRPTDNALTERFYGTIKQEEIYLVGEYPDEQTAVEEIKKYIDYYNFERPHQSLFNFTPHFIFALNNKTEAMKSRQELKKNSIIQRRQYWKDFQAKQLEIQKPDDLLNS